MYVNAEINEKTSIIDILNEIDKKSNENENEMLNVNNYKYEQNVNSASKRATNYSGFYVMVKFIEDNKSDVPESLRNKCMQNEYGFTVAMYWIRIMQNYIYKMIQTGKINETIPLWMRHNPEIRDNRGWTIAMHWVTVFKCDVPLWMRHDPYIQNSMGKTIGMLYLTVLYDVQNISDVNYIQQCEITSETFLPLWMRHDTNICDNDGNSIIDYWLKFTNLDVPTWMLPKDINEQNKMGETIAMLWVIHRKTPPPLDIKCNCSLKTAYGMTIKDIFKKLVPCGDVPNWMYERENEREY